MVNAATFVSVVVFGTLLIVSAEAEITCSWFNISSTPLEVQYSNSNKVGSYANFRCPFPKLFGNATAVCQRDGTWSSLQPRCKILVSPRKLRVLKMREKVLLDETQLNKNSSVTSSPQAEECFCTLVYEDNNMIIRDKGQEVRSGSKVKRGEQIALNCKSNDTALTWSNGLRLYGSANLKCNTCQNWTRQDLPFCLKYRRGEPVIHNVWGMDVTLNGVLKIGKMQDLILLCSTADSYPYWNSPGGFYKQSHYTTSSRENHATSYMTSIAQTDGWINGKYECHGTSRNSNRPSILDVEVIDACSINDLTDLEKEKEFFLDSGKSLNIECTEGYTVSNTITCVNGHWNISQNPCANVLCYTHQLNYIGLKKPTQETFQHSQSFSIRCETGFEKVTHKELATCWNGQWDLTVDDLLCYRVLCYTNQLNYMGLKKPSQESFQHSHSFSIQCETGFEKVTRKKLATCWNGLWDLTDDDLLCFKACSDLPALIGGFVSYSPPANVKIQPRSPIMPLLNNPTARNTRFPIDLSAPLNSKVNMTIPVSVPVSLPPGLHWHGTRAIYECEHKYYELVGSTTRRCEKTGEWSGRHPVCMPVCGRSDAPRSPFIVNGKATDIGQWPWQVGITRLIEGHFILECGASLLSEKWVVTAAHCVTRTRETTTFDPQFFRIYLGKYYREDSKDDEYVQVRNVKEIHIHWEYDPFIYDADIALLLLDSPVILNPRVQPICLPTEKTSRENLVEGNKGVVTGWGIDKNGNPSETLQQAVLPVITNGNCQKSYKETRHLLTVTENMFCAGYADGRTDVCSGDSGGPMVFTDNSSQELKWVLEGIISWGSSSGCAKENLYGGYTKVGKFVDWIKEYL